MEKENLILEVKPEISTKEIENELIEKNEINKERYREAFERKNNAAARDAFLNAISGVQVNINPFALVTNILISSARSYMDYNKRKDDLAVELDDQLWKLEQSEMDELARLRQQVQDIYIETNLKDVYYRSNGKRYTLKEFVKSDGEFSEITSLLGEGISYDDGGSMLYSSDEYDLSVLVCGTLDGNKDIYVGDYTMYYDNAMCK